MQMTQLQLDLKESERRDESTRLAGSCVAVE